MEIEYSLTKEDVAALFAYHYGRSRSTPKPRPRERKFVIVFIFVLALVTALTLLPPKGLPIDVWFIIPVICTHLHPCSIF
jgi:hypothetical protein